MRPQLEGIDVPQPLDAALVEPHGAGQWKT